MASLGQVRGGKGQPIGRMGELRTASELKMGAERVDLCGLSLRREKRRLERKVCRFRPIRFWVGGVITMIKN